MSGSCQTGADDGPGGELKQHMESGPRATLPFWGWGGRVFPALDGVIPRVPNLLPLRTRLCYKQGDAS